MSDLQGGTVVDSCILIDLFTGDPVWASWSLAQLRAASLRGPLIINEIIYAEVSVGFSLKETLDAALETGGFISQALPKAAAFLAGKAFYAYRLRGGSKSSPLPDFFIGAHAAVLGLPLLTRDTRRVKQAYPQLQLITPEGSPVK